MAATGRRQQANDRIEQEHPLAPAAAFGNAD